MIPVRDRSEVAPFDRGVAVAGGVAIAVLHGEIFPCPKAWRKPYLG
jgi:hypothetical protein